MSIRIMGGTLRGRNIKTPASFNATLRPTASRVRESLFNILRGKVEGRRVLDLFAGMGTLGIEALSHGATETVFVEKDARNVSLLSDNLAILGVADRARVVRGALPEALDRVAGEFGLVFVDPPYERDLEADALAGLVARDLLAPGATIIVEKSKHSDIVFAPMFELLRSHRVGDTDLCFLSRKVGA